MRISEIFELGMGDHIHDKTHDKIQDRAHGHHGGGRAVCKILKKLLPIHLPNCGDGAVLAPCCAEHELAGPTATAGGSDPTSVSIPSIGANSTLIELGLHADGSPEVPALDTPGQAGWCSSGVRPGEAGAAVVCGHRDGYGELGVFWKLDRLCVGDDVRVGRADGSTLTFRVRDLEQIPKARFESEKVAKVYGNVDHPALRIVTCGGRFVGGEYGYADNIVAFADLV